MMSQPEMRGPGAERPGAILRRARESVGMSLEDVAGELRLSITQIKALEDDDHTELPGSTYVRGYLRSYARLVKVNEELVLPPVRSESISGPVRSSVRPVGRQAKSSDRWVRLISYGLGVVFVGLVVTWWQTQGEFTFDDDLFGKRLAFDAQQVDNRTGTETEAGVSPVDRSLSTQTDGTGAANKAVTAATGVDTVDQAKPSVAEVSGESAGATPSATAPSATDKATVAAVTTNIVQGPQSKSAKIVLRFSDASWAEIRDARDKRLLHQSFDPGRVVEVEGEPPFRVFIGNASGVRIQYNGKPLDITPFQTGLYARFVLPGDNAAAPTR